MRIAIIGARSVPGRYGGFDTVATELAPRLARRGLDVTVYCQPRYAAADRPPTYNGVRLVYLPAIARRSFETVSHEALCLLHALRARYDLIYVLGLRASILYMGARAARVPVCFNTDGLDWRRRKWGALARRYLHWSERMAVRVSAHHLVADSRAIAAYFSETYGVSPEFIPYGAPVIDGASTEPLARWGLEPRTYFLVVCRIEPENNVDVIVSAFEAARTNMKLVVVGATNYRSKYLERLRQTASPAVMFVGAVYDRPVVDALYSHALAYVHGHEIGGTNPALLHGMAAGACALAHDVVYNREVLGDAGLYWQPHEESLAALIDKVVADRALAARLGQAARARARAQYDWEAVAGAYQGYFERLLSAFSGR